MPSALKNFLRARLGQDRLLELVCRPARRLADLAAPFRRPAPPGRVAVVSMWNDHQAQLARLTSPNKAAYCARWGYHWLPRTDGFDPSRPVAWSKLVFIREALADHDWVFWTDADSIITNPALPLDDLLRRSADLLITRDRVGYNSGSFLLRRCPWSFEFLRECWDYPSTEAYRSTYRVETDRMWENRSVDSLLRHYRHRRHTDVVPQRRLNSYLPDLVPCGPEGAHQPDDFVLHLPGVDNETRIRELSRRLPPS